MAILSPFIRYSLLALGLAGAATAVPAQAPSLAMLDRLEKGSWQLRERGKDAVVQTICVGDARRMIQVYHPGATCSRYVIEDTPSSVTVHYRSEEHTSELQSLMRISYAVFCLKKKHTHIAYIN